MMGIFKKDGPIDTDQTMSKEQLVGRLEEDLKKPERREGENTEDTRRAWLQHGDHTGHFDHAKEVYDKAVEEAQRNIKKGGG